MISQPLEPSGSNIDRDYGRPSQSSQRTVVHGGVESSSQESVAAVFLEKCSLHEQEDQDDRQGYHHASGHENGPVGAVELLQSA